MSPTMKSILEELARSKGHFHRHDVLRAMVSLATALKGLIQSKNIVGMQRTQLDSGINGLVGLMNRSDEVKKFAPNGLAYQKTQPQKLLLGLVNIIKAIQEEASTETLEQTRQRKLEMDNLLGRGQKQLDAKNVADAEASFQSAMDLYVDENKLFYMIGFKYFNAGLFKQAIKYLQKGMEKADDAAFLLAAKAYEQLNDLTKAEATLKVALKKFGENAEVYGVLAQLFFKKNQLKPAYAAALKATRMDPNLAAPKKLLKKIKKKAAA